MNDRSESRSPHRPSMAHALPTRSKRRSRPYSPPISRCRVSRAARMRTNAAPSTRDHRDRAHRRRRTQGARRHAALRRTRKTAPDRRLRHAHRRVHLRARHTRFSGVITNRDDRIPGLIETGVTLRRACVAVPAPRGLRGPVEERRRRREAVHDRKRSGSQILARLFLRRFVPNDIPWVHLDLAAGNHKGALAHVPSDVSGFGVRFTLKFLRDREILS